MGSLSKAEFIQIMMATTTCLHYEPDYKINKPLLLMVGDQDATGNIRKIMPVWAEHEPDCRFVAIPNAKHAADLDNPEFFPCQVDGISRQPVTHAAESRPLSSRPVLSHLQPRCQNRGLIFLERENYLFFLAPVTRAPLASCEPGGILFDAQSLSFCW